MTVADFAQRNGAEGSVTEKLCQRYLKAAASTLRKAGLARGKLIDRETGEMCMLGAMNACGVYIGWDERQRIEHHIVSLLPVRPKGMAGRDKYNADGRSEAMHIAWWNNMVAKDGEEVALKLEEAAISC